MASHLMKIVASSVVIADKAGSVIRAIMQSGHLGVIDKADKDGNFDPQTAADRNAQSVIVASLTKQFPGLRVVGEEEGCDEIPQEELVTDMDSEVLKQSCPKDYEGLSIDDFVVWVDPLDGTKEFTEGNITHVTVLIGISAKGKAVGGVVHQPFNTDNGRTLWGVVGLGMFGTAPVDVPLGRRIITTTKSHGNDLVNKTIEALKPDQVIKTGGCGYKVLQVIEGVADAYVFATPGTKKWDSCAPEAIIRACGGTITDILNKEIDYLDISPKNFMNWTGLLCTMKDHASYADNVPADIKSHLSELRASKM